MWRLHVWSELAGARNVRQDAPAIIGKGTISGYRIRRDRTPYTYHQIHEFRGNEVEGASRKSTAYYPGEIMRKYKRAGCLRLVLFSGVLVSALAPGIAAAGPPPPSVGFCEGVTLNASKKSCKGPGPGPVNEILAETSSSAEICVVLNEGNGVFIGKTCGHHLVGTEVGGVTGWPEITDPSGATMTVTGVYTT
jgi:hypothetical protein